jgi:hypothetical protein
VSCSLFYLLSHENMENARNEIIKTARVICCTKYYSTNLECSILYYLADNYGAGSQIYFSLPRLGLPRVASNVMVRQSISRQSFFSFLRRRRETKMLETKNVSVCSRYQLKPISFLSYNTITLDYRSRSCKLNCGGCRSIFR